MMCLIQNNIIKFAFRKQFQILADHNISGKKKVRIQFFVVLIKHAIRNGISENLLKGFQGFS